MKKTQSLSMCDAGNNIIVTTCMHAGMSISLKAKSFFYLHFRHAFILISSYAYKFIFFSNSFFFCSSRLFFFFFFFLMKTRLNETMNMKIGLQKMFECVCLCLAKWAHSHLIAHSCWWFEVRQYLCSCNFQFHREIRWQNIRQST